LGVPFSNNPKLAEVLSSEFGKADFLLLYQKPELTIARMLEQGSTCEQALDQWLSAAQLFINLHRHHRQNSHVLDIDSAIESPDEFFNTCKQRYGLSGSAEAFVAACGEATTETPDTLHVLVAKQLLQQTEQAEALISEISASTLPLANDSADEELGLDLDSLLKQQKQLSTEKQEIAEENELLILQLHQIQEELESYYLQNQDLQQEKSRLETLLAAETEQAKQAKAKINQIQKELKHAQQEVRQALQRSGLTQTELASIQQTLSYRLARPLINWQKGITASRLQRRNLQLIESSDYFDPAWYLENYPDVKQASISPATHYLLYGGFEGRDPGPRFSSDAYLQRHPDVAGSGINPLVHYLRHGEKEGRKPS
ncbi:MAG: hypothetical protein RLN85_11195, partial [Pseudomonadales bacterium]